MSWDREFDSPVPGFRTLRDAANYIMTLSRSEQQKEHWQTAAEVVLAAAEGKGPMLHAVVGMNKALNHGRPSAKEPRRKAAKKYRIVSGEHLSKPAAK